MNGEIILSEEEYLATKNLLYRGKGWSENTMVLVEAIATVIENEDCPLHIREALLKALQDGQAIREEFEG